MVSIKSVLLAVVFLVSGCATQSAVENDFGNAVRHMTQNQRAHPATSANPIPDPVDGTDGQRIEAVMQTYREGVTKPDASQKDLTINIGN